MAVQKLMQFNITTYMSGDGVLIMSREYGIHPESNMPLAGKWVLRNRITGEFIDSDTYSSDLAERNNINIDSN